MKLEPGTKISAPFKIFSISFWILLNVGLFYAFYTLYKTWRTTDATFLQIFLVMTFLGLLINAYPYAIYRTILHEQKEHSDDSMKTSTSEYFSSKVSSLGTTKAVLIAWILSMTYGITTNYILEKDVFQNPVGILLILGYSMIGVAILCFWYVLRK